MHINNQTQQCDGQSVCVCVRWQGQIKKTALQKKNQFRSRIKKSKANTSMVKEWSDFAVLHQCVEIKLDIKKTLQTWQARSHHACCDTDMQAKQGPNDSIQFWKVLAFLSVQADLWNKEEGMGVDLNSGRFGWHVRLISAVRINLQTGFDFSDFFLIHHRPPTLSA